MDATFFDIAKDLAATGCRLADKGWAPATSGNYSARHANGAAITVSGAHKALLTADDIMMVDLAGQSMDGRKPSAETLLHTTLYQQNHEIGAVLHTHSIAGVCLSKRLDSDHLVLQDYELLKALPDLTTHQHRVIIPIVDNDQDMVRLSQLVLQRLAGLEQPVGYLIRGHGAYAWGNTLFQAEQAIEALETILACEWQLHMAGNLLQPSGI